MNRRGLLLTAFLAPVLTVLAACSGGSDVAPAQPDMAGFYLFNEEESDDPAQLTGMPGRPAGFGEAAAWAAAPARGSKSSRRTRR
jgi:hypothetical protein